MYQLRCAIAREATVSFDDNQRVRNRLQADIDAWLKRLYENVRQSGRAEHMVESMQKLEKGVECRR